jgi:hypothetical protein
MPARRPAAKGRVQLGKIDGANTVRELAVSAPLIVVRGNGEFSIIFFKNVGLCRVRHGLLGPLTKINNGYVNFSAGKFFTCHPADDRINQLLPRQKCYRRKHAQSHINRTSDPLVRFVAGA